MPPHTRPNKWETLAKKVLPPDDWADYSEIERKIFLLIRGVSPPTLVKDISDQLGIPSKDVQESIDRRQMRTAAPSRRVPVARFLKLMETAAERILVSMDEKRVGQADLKSLGAVFRDLMNARALLLGEPTQIIGSAHRQQMNDLVQMILAEARHRGLTIQHDAVSGVTVTRRPIAIDTTSRPA